MNFNIDEILCLSDNREFKVINVVNINDIDYLYLKNMNLDQYTIVKVIDDKIFNLNGSEFSLVIENLFKSRWGY